MAVIKATTVLPHYKTDEPTVLAAGDPCPKWAEKLISNADVLGPDSEEPKDPEEPGEGSEDPKEPDKEG